LWSIEDAKNGKIPVTFPGSIKITDGLINDRYRKYSDATNDEFYYFVTRILTAINPNKSKFNHHKSNTPISEIFSVTDEAFGLLIILNEHDVWTKQAEIQRTGGGGGKLPKLKKKFCDGRSGDSKGWYDVGHSVFHELCRTIDRLRKSEKGKELELLMMKRFAEETGDIRKHMRSDGGNTTESNVEYYETEGLTAILEEYDSESDLCTKRRMTEHV
jgi:hypothetical protein